MKWEVRASNRMLISGVIFIIAGFVLLALFPAYASFYPDRPMLWLYAICTGLIFELGLFAIIKVKIRGVVTALLVSFCWSFVLLVPVPQGYEEPVYGVSLILLVAAMIFYDKHRNSQKKSPKRPE